MQDGYKVLLTARNEGIEYSDIHGIYRFNLRREGNTWHLLLPGSKGKNYEKHQLSPKEEQRILPRIKKHLEHIKWFVFFGRSYKIEVVNEPIST